MLESFVWVFFCANKFMVLTLVQAKGKDKVHHRTGHENLEGE
jgi:hypothetical protein